MAQHSGTGSRLVKSPDPTPRADTAALRVLGSTRLPQLSTLATRHISSDSNILEQLQRNLAIEQYDKNTRAPRRLAPTRARALA